MPRGAGEVFAEVFHAGIIEGVGGVVGEDALLVVILFVAGGVAGGAGCRVGDDRVQRRGLKDAGDGKGIHRERGESFALGDAVGHDAGGGAVGDAHAVADHEDDVFDFIAGGVTEGDDFEIAGGDRGDAAVVGGGDLKGVNAGRGVAVSALGGDDGVGGQAGGVGEHECDRAGHADAVHDEADADDDGTGIGLDGGLEVETLAGEEASDDRRLGVAVGEESARRCEPGDRGRSEGGGGEQAAKRGEREEALI